MTRTLEQTGAFFNNLSRFSGGARSQTALPVHGTLSIRQTDSAALAGIAGGSLVIQEAYKQTISVYILAIGSRSGHLIGY